MPKEMGFAYSQMSYQEKVAPPAGPTFALAIVFVFLLLAALYESWRLPWAVLLGSPLVALGSFFGVWLMGYDNNVYVQIGNIMLIGLAAKNAILIVEFAKAKQDEGMSIEDAALESARLRFRPILMTAFAFILGVVPLMIASGAGAGAQNVMGTGGVLGHARRDVLRRVPDPRQLRVRPGSREEEAGEPRAGPDRRHARTGRSALIPCGRSLVTALCLFLSACAIGPRYRRPEVQMQPAYRGDATAPADDVDRGPALVGGVPRSGAQGPDRGGAAAATTTCASPPRASSRRAMRSA